MHFSFFLHGMFFLQGAIASPVGEPVADVEPRNIAPRSPALGDLPFPKIPSLKSKGSKSCDSNSQSNACSSGDSYCCVSDGKGGHTCSISNSCSSKIICCNNNNGYQMCIGDMDFNMPITINIYKKK